MIRPFVAATLIAVLVAGLLLAPTVAAEDITSPALAAERSPVALVIGNAGYASGSLRKPVADARGMADLLRDLGYEVIEVVDADQAAMRRAADRFGERLAITRGLGVAYFSGHAVQIGGDNYLLPVDLPPNADAITVQSRALALGYLLDRMRAARPGTNVVFLDACRTGLETAVGRTANATSGMAAILAGPGEVVAYATPAGTVADEGPPTEPHSRFTAALLHVLTTDAALPLDTVLKRVHQRVKVTSQGRQVPVYTYGAGIDPIVLAPPRPVTPATTDAPAAPEAVPSPPQDGKDATRATIPAPGACYEAVRTSTPSIHLPKDLAAYCYNLRNGTLKLKEGAHDEALAAYGHAADAAAALVDADQRALAIDEARAARAIALEVTGDIPAALALMAKPGVAARDTLVLARGYQLARHGLYREAARELDKAVRDMPEFVCELDRRAIRNVSTIMRQGVCQFRLGCFQFLLAD